MKIYINFKMNKTQKETKEYFYEFLSLSKETKHQFNFALPYTSIPVAKFLTEGTGIEISAQNVCEDEEGKSTGDISARMLADCGVASVLVGHNERKIKYKETNRTINRKIKIALKNGLEVVLCVGENLTERNTLTGVQSIKDQIEEALKGLYENELENIVIAYEPVWAVGSGQSPTIKEVETAVKAIRKVISNDFSAEAGEKICVIYGGSINAKNVAAISKINGLSGLLIGNSALQARELVKIASLIG